MRLHSAFLLAFVLLAPTVLSADQQTSRAPVLLLEVNNSGEVRTTLTVYSDGELILAKRDIEHPGGEICSKTVPVEDVEAIASGLRDAGAMRLSDLDVVPGFTRKTISVFSGPDQHGLVHGNTYSYSRAEGPHVAVAQVVNFVILTYFPVSECD
jgi:hypothetical protein